MASKPPVLLLTQYDGARQCVQEREGLAVQLRHPGVPAPGGEQGGVRAAGEAEHGDAAPALPACQRGGGGGGGGAGQ